MNTTIDECKKSIAQLLGCNVVSSGTMKALGYRRPLKTLESWQQLLQHLTDVNRAESWYVLEIPFSEVEVGEIFTVGLEIYTRVSTTSNLARLMGKVDTGLNGGYSLWISTETGDANIKEVNPSTVVKVKRSRGFIT